MALKWPFEAAAKKADAPAASVQSTSTPLQASARLRSGAVAARLHEGVPQRAWVSTNFPHRAPGGFHCPEITFCM